jgi:hypothetical protein
MPASPVQSKTGSLQRAQSMMALRGFSLRTCAAYRGWIIRYVRFHANRHPGEMGEADVFRFLSCLREERGVATATATQALSALLFLSREVLGRALRVSGMQAAGTK